MNLSLFFISSKLPELAEIVFAAADQPVRIARRGKGLVYRDDQASFQWTKAVKSFALLTVGTKVAALTDTRFELVGGAGSAAASLDFAICKPTDWIAGLFGGKRAERDLRRIVFKMTNSEQKLPGPVTVRLSSHYSSRNGIRIYCNDRELTAAEELRELFIALGGELQPNQSIVNTPPTDCTIPSTDAPAAHVTTTVPWNTREDFESLVVTEVTTSISEVEVMELLGVRQAESRLNQVRPSESMHALEPLLSQLRTSIPPEGRRYSSVERFPLLQDTTSPIRCGCPPMAMGALLLLRALRVDFSIPVEIFSHHQSSSAILSKIDEDQLDYAVLSWGAIEKMSNAGGKESKALMLLPRTSIDLVVPRTGVSTQYRQLPIYVSKDDTGYPYQYFHMLRASGVPPWSDALAEDANTVEIVALLTKIPACAIVSFPFSGVLTLHFDYKALEVLPISQTRLGDNVMCSFQMGKGLKEIDTQLCVALRSAWYRFLEDPMHLRNSVKALLSDPTYIISLNRLSGLYSIQDNADRT